MKSCYNKTTRTLIFQEKPPGGSGGFYGVKYTLLDGMVTDWITLVGELIIDGIALFLSTPCILLCFLLVLDQFVSEGRKNHLDLNFVGLH